MKIGILTYHSVYNFGANLQCYSTVCYLRNNGFEPIVINWIPEDLELKYDRDVPSDQARAHNEFVVKYLPLSDKCRTSKDIAAIIRKEDIKLVIIGSDAVLQHKTLIDRIIINKKGIRIREKLSNLIFPSPFWGEFVNELGDNFPVALLSASSQNINFKLIKGRLKQNIGKALKRFNIVTVRDEWTKKMVAYFTKNAVLPEITPDPVFAYNENIVIQLTKEEILKKFDLPEKYILLSFYNKYSVSQKWVETFQTLMTEKGYLCAFIATPEGKVPFSNIKVIEFPVCPTEWYALIKYSAGYVGERMHPVIVSLHNNVPFFSFDTYGIKKFKYFVNQESSKIYDILNRAGYLEHMVNIEGKGYSSPGPGYVADKILNFDYGKCENFKSMQYKVYNDLMKNITNLIK